MRNCWHALLQGAICILVLTSCGSEQNEPAAVDGRAGNKAANVLLQPEPIEATAPAQGAPAAVVATDQTSSAHETWPEPDVERREVAAQIKEVRQELKALSGASKEEQQATRERLADLQRRLSQIGRYKKQPELTDLPSDWQKTYRVEKNGSEADLLVQVGDIDNLGFGWPEGFDPFEGKPTPRHGYPWRPEADDPDGTDRIMIGSGMTEQRKARRDGYTQNTSRPYNRPRPLSIEYALEGIEVKAAALQLFVDDFQAPVFGNRFEVTLDGHPAPDLAATINALEQTGPIGKIITLQLLPEHLGELRDGHLVVAIDDPVSNIGDGFAFDFVRLLINPKDWKHTGTIRGFVVEKGVSKPVTGALVSAGNVKQVETADDGMFELSGVPAGMVVTSASHPEYLGNSEQTDLASGQSVQIVIELEKNPNTGEAFAQQLEREGKIDLYGIYFDLDKATFKPESESTLQQVRSLMEIRPNLHVVIAGHTDSEGGDAYNLELSKRRAAAVVTWLTSHDVGSSRMQSEGLGETQPVADNASIAGRALNRRVEIRDAER